MTPISSSTCSTRMSSFREYRAIAERTVVPGDIGYAHT